VVAVVQKSSGAVSYFVTGFVSGARSITIRGIALRIVWKSCQITCQLKRLD